MASTGELGCLRRLWLSKGGSEMLSRVLSTGWVGWGQPVVLRRRVVGGTTMGEERKTKGRGEVRERLLERERDSKDIKKIMSRLIRNKGKRRGSHGNIQYKL